MDSEPEKIEQWISSENSVAACALGARMVSEDDALMRDAVRMIDEGNAIEQQGRIEDAMPYYDAAVRLAPTLARAHLNRGNILLELGNTEGALGAYATALAQDPNYLGAHYNIGNAYARSGQHEAALAAYRAAIALDPEFAHAQVAMGCVLEGLGQPDAAVTSYRRALTIDPGYGEVHSNLGNALRTLGQMDAAIESYERAIEIRPDFAEAHNNLGSALNELGRLGDAVASYRRALEIKPKFAEAHNNLGSALRETGQVIAAVASYRQALHINPNYAVASSNLGNALQELGRCDDAAASFRRALEVKPDFAEAHSSLLFCLSHDETISSQALFAEHCRFGERFEAPLRSSWPRHCNDRATERCLQIGFVSGDLRDHAVAYFLEPILGYLAAYRGLSLHAYYNHATEGSITPRLRSHFHHWHRIAGLSDAALAQKIAADGIDILIDLSGHTGENRLLCFARKPAPVQVSWMGYPGTTGLSAMDYYLADRYFLPPGKFDDQFTEKLVHLPASAPFLPDRRAPPVNALPALSNGYLTFGSFNRLSKLTPSAIALWSRLLQALPEARMVLGGMPKDSQPAMLADWFARGGVARERLKFYPRCDVPAYLALHHQVDICLDTFPYTGGTTTNHALWMGVPTLTLAGPTVSGRQGAAILGHVGLEAFVARDADDFQAKGLSWAGDLAALSAVRSGLRQRCEQSPIRSPKLIAAGLEQALRTMWRRRCAGLPTETFETTP
jgi:protein O-GlcNAc transferase